MLVDTFDRYFEPDNVRAALAVLEAGGYQVAIAGDGGVRPLCCGRTYLAAGLIERARTEARRTLAALEPFIARDVPVIGIEPACLLTLRDEFTALLPGPGTEKLAAQALLFEEFLAAEADGGRLDLRLKPLEERRALVHGHCHQKAFGAMAAVTRTLELVPNLEVEVIEAGCCGMAGAFGYAARALRDVATDRRVGTATGGASGSARMSDRRGRRELPPTDRPHHTTHRPTRRPRAGGGAGLAASRAVTAWYRGARGRR
jgi:Fe-S oxidoreductase